MILQALNQYYHRKAIAEDSNTAPEGFTWKPIPFVILLDVDGGFQGLEIRWTDAKKKIAKSFLLPKEVKRSRNIKANLLWDNNEYLLGVSVDAGRNDDEIPLRHQAFLQRIRDVFGDTPEDEGVRAALAFLERGDFSAVTAHRNWQDVVVAKGGNFTFQLEDDLCVVAERPAVAARIAETVGTVDAEAEPGLCLVTGTRQPIERLHPAIKGVWGAQSSGANIISFNLDAFRSFGHEQGLNAPVGKSAAFAYTEALNMLLAKGSTQRIQVGDASTIFWGAQKTIAEEILPAALEGRVTPDEPDVGEHAIQALYGAPWKDAYLEPDVQIPLYILGLAPNASRIAVRFWHVGTVGEIAGNVRQHFDDLKIIQPAFEKTGHLGIYRLLASIAAQGKSENIPPNLAGDTMRAILAGSAYPYSLLQNAVMRNKAEQNVTFARAALIKASLNRLLRENRLYGKEMTMPLPEAIIPESADTEPAAYQYGRMFRMFENIQWHALGNVNATVKDKYYSSASCNTALVFPMLLDNAQKHLSKIAKDKPGLARSLDRKLGELAMRHRNGFKKSLPMEEQGLFAVGYYHEKYSKSDQNTSEIPEEKEAA
jgi:CRISPR-associated protein Csd1